MGSQEDVPGPSCYSQHIDRQNRRDIQCPKKSQFWVCKSNSFYYFRGETEAIPGLEHGKIILMVVGDPELFFPLRGPPATVTSNRLSPSGVSWADKVKASHPGTAPRSEEAAAKGQGPPAAQKPSRRTGKFGFFFPFPVRAALFWYPQSFQSKARN